MRGRSFENPKIKTENNMEHLCNLNPQTHLFALLYSTFLSCFYAWFLTFIQNLFSCFNFCPIFFPIIFFGFFVKFSSPLILTFALGFLLAFMPCFLTPFFYLPLNHISYRVLFLGFWLSLRFVLFHSTFLLRLYVGFSKRKLICFNI
jgi:hypothetical protein